MIKKALINRPLKLSPNLCHPLKSPFSGIFDTLFLPICALLSRPTVGLVLFFLLLGGAISAVQAQSGKFDGEVEEEGGTAPTEYALQVETNGLTPDKKVTITVTGSGVKTADASYSVKPATQVTVSLPSPLPEGVAYISLQGLSSKGNWFLNPLGSLPATFSFTMPAADITLRFGFEVKEKPTPNPGPAPSPAPDPTPTIFHNVTLPAVEGAVTEPAAGQYQIENWASFGFYLTLKEGYLLSTPVVGTSRGETLQPDKQGKYWVKQVRSDLTISIDSIRPDLPPVANEQIRPTNGLRIHTAPGQLCIATPSSVSLYIYNIGGLPVKTATLTAGLHTIALPRGIYILRIEGKSYKVIL